MPMWKGTCGFSSCKNIASVALSWRMTASDGCFRCTRRSQRTTDTEQFGEGLFEAGLEDRGLLHCIQIDVHAYGADPCEGDHDRHGRDPRGRTERVEPDHLRSG